MGTPLTPDALLLRGAARSGWTSERATLAPAQIEELLSLIEPSLLEAKRSRFSSSIQRIFASAVENVVTFETSDTASPAKMHKKLKEFTTLLEKTQQAIANLDPVLNRVLDGELREDYSRVGKKLTPKSSMRLWQPEISTLLSVVIEASRGCKIEAKKGVRDVVYRQMVRSLAAFILDVTGEVPSRSVQRKRSDGLQGSTDDYWFLDLSQKLAAFVSEQVNIDVMKRQSMSQSGAVPISSSQSKKKIKVPTLTGMVRDELDFLKREAEAQKENFAPTLPPLSSRRLNGGE
jgi:hypothetical protein